MIVPDELIRFFQERDGFFIATHVDPEGDAIGSSLALSLALRSLGKEVTVFNKDFVPKSYRYLPHYADVVDTAPGRIDTLVLMDCNSLDRAGLERCDIGYAAVIDHHMTAANYGDIRWIVPAAPATGLMTYYLIEALGIPVNEDMAVNLYSAIGIDTGLFRYSNTTAECLQVAAELIRAGADPAYIADRLYNNYSVGRFMLLKRMLDTMEIHGPVAVAVISRELFRETGTTAEDTETFVNFALKMNDASVSVMIRERANGSWKISLRSKGAIDIAGVAASFGGGGHRNAAGCIIEGTLASVKQTLLQKLNEISAP